MSDQRFEGYSSIILIELQNIWGDKPTVEEKIEFGHDASDIHLQWAEKVKDNPALAQDFGDEDWHLECAVLHEETAIELEELAKQEGEKQKGCLSFFRRSK